MEKNWPINEPEFSQAGHDPLFWIDLLRCYLFSLKGEGLGNTS